MEQYNVKIRSVRNITHDVLQIETDKPRHLSFIPGQATEISINKEGWRDKRRPFTFTSSPEDNYLQFTIKIYASHNGVTNQIRQLQRNDELILNDVFGSIAYKNEGIFIAGGAGITPFIPIFRFLKTKNEIGNNILFFANKTKADIILKEEFTSLLGNNFINILSGEEAKGFPHGFITERLLKENVTDFNRNIYVCGPPRMMVLVENILSNLHVDEKLIVRETF